MADDTLSPSLAGRLVRRAAAGAGELAHTLRQEPIKFAVLVGAALLLAGLVGWPLGTLFWKGFQVKGDGPFTLTNYISVFQEGGLIDALENSLYISGWTTLFSLLIAVPMAWAVARTDMPLKTTITAASAATFVVPSFIVVISWIFLLGPNEGSVTLFLESIGLALPFRIFSREGLIFVLTLHLYPLIFHTLASALSNMDASYEVAAGAVGAGKLRTLWSVTMPLMLPALVSGVILVFLDSLALFGAPRAIGLSGRFHVLTTKIYVLFRHPPRFELAAAAALPLMCFTVVALWVQKWLLGRKRFTTLTGRAAGAKPIELGLWKWALLAFCLLIAFLGLLLPVSTLVISSFLSSWGEPISWENLTLESYTVIADSPDVYTAVSNGLRLSFAAATICVLLAIAIVWMVERTEIPGRGLLSFLAMVPFAFPSVALAVGLILIFIHPPFELYGTLWIILVAYTVKRIAFAYIFARNALKQLSPEMEEAARVLGAGWLRTMGEVTLPLLKGGLAAAWVLIFSICLRELTMSILFYLPGTETMAVIVFNYFEDGTFEVAAAISVVILVISFASVYLVKSVIGKGVQEV